MAFTRFTPTGGAHGPLVMLAHGLEREKERMADWGAHLASWGLDVVTPDLCQSGILDLDQEQNALDMVELVASLAVEEVLYAGHSAGGLAAFVATGVDPIAVGMLGLDPTEWLGLGGEYAALVEVPAYGILGDPGPCNLSNNFLDLYDELGEGRALRLTEADHCDFERPTDWVCTVPCGTSSNDLFSDEEIQETLMGLVTGFLVWQAGVDPEGEMWWSPGGVGYQALLSTGAISEP